MWDQFNTSIKAILDANTLLQSVYDYEVSNPDGIPFATLTPSANENDYHTTTANSRVYAFTLRLFTDRGGQSTHQASENSMRSLVDSVLDDLDKNHQLSGLTVPSGYAFLFMEAAPASWGYVGREFQMRVAEIAVRCHVEVDTTIIS